MEKLKLNKGFLLAPALMVVAGCEDKINPDHVGNGFRIGQRDAICVASPSINISTLENDIRTAYRNGETIRHERLVELRNIVQGCRSDLASGLLAVASVLAAPSESDGADYVVFNEQIDIGYRVGACGARPYVNTDFAEAIQAGRELGRDVASLEKLRQEMSACERPTE